MGKLIQDVVPPENQRLSEQQKQIHANYVQHVDTDILVTELAMRGVTVTDIFGMYYALEAIAAAQSDELFGNLMKPITLEDAELAGLAPLPEVPNLNPQPF